MKNRYWMPKQVWKDQDVIVLGGGSSLENFDFEVLRGHLVIGCNGAIKLGWAIVDVIHFCDIGFFDLYDEWIGKYQGTLTSSLYKTLPMPEVKTLKRKLHGLSTEGIGYNGNAGAGALNLALLYGAARVFLLGFDLNPTPENVETDGWYKREAKIMPDQVRQRMAKGWPKVAKDLPEMFPQADVINLNPESGIQDFRKMDWEDVQWQHV